MAKHSARDATDTPEPEGNGLSHDDRETASIVGLLRRLTNELATLVRQEIALAGAEVSRTIRMVLASASAVAIGGAVLYAGVLVLLASAVLGLATAMAPWLAALIVGVAVGIIGYVMVHIGVKRMTPDQWKPKHIPESLRRDKEVLTRKTS